MKILKILVLLPLALFSVLLLLAVGFFVLSMVPPVVGWVTFGLVAVFLAWFFFARGNSPAAGSEASLMGRSSSKDGLL